MDVNRQHSNVQITLLIFCFPLGEFGIVYKAHLLPQMRLDSKLSCCPLPQTVAVKTLKGRYYQTFSVTKAESNDKVEYIKLHYAMQWYKIEN